MDQLRANYASESEEELKPQAKTARELKSYTVAFKLKAIDHANKVSVSSASKKFSVSRGCIQNWKKQENQLRLPKSVLSFIHYNSC
uniref:Brinker DNA-binding domain-containing protein n=1 Tax=Ditylenchus dipsaci TaxID=166011 RepID=A0A915DFU0_9BILA